MKNECRCVKFCGNLWNFLQKCADSLWVCLLTFHLLSLMLMTQEYCNAMRGFSLIWKFQKWIIFSAEKLSVLSFKKKKKKTLTAPLASFSRQGKWHVFEQSDLAFDCTIRARPGKSELQGVVIKLVERKPARERDWVSVYVWDFWGT